MGPGELVLVFLAVLVLFGPRRIPEIARSIGKIIRDLQHASQDFRDEIMRLDQEPSPPPPAMTAPGKGEPFPETAERPDESVARFPGESDASPVGESAVSLVESGVHRGHLPSVAEDSMFPPTTPPCGEVSDDSVG